MKESEFIEVQQGPHPGNDRMIKHIFKEIDSDKVIIKETTDD